MRSVRRFFVVACGPLFAFGLAAYFLRGAFALGSRAELDYGEGIVMWQAAHVTDLHTAYRSVNEYPHIVFHYTPLYHLASRAMALVTGDLLVAGRLVSLLSLAAVCMILALVAWNCIPAKLGSSRLLGTAAAGLLPFTMPVWGWASYMRVDTLGMLFSFGGMALFILSLRRPGLIYPAFFLFVAAVYTKQVIVSAAAACFLLLCLESPRRAFKAAVLVLVTGLSVLAYMQMATDGMFFQNIFVYNQNPFMLGRLQRHWVEYASKAGVVLAAAIALPAAFLFRRRRGLREIVDRVRRLVQRDLFGRAMIVSTLTLVFAFIMSATVGKVGSNYNYFFELDLTSSLSAGLFIAWLLKDQPRFVLRSHARFAVAVTAALVLHSVSTVSQAIDARYDMKHPRPNYSEELVQALKAIPGPVYSTNMLLLMQAGKEIPAEPAIITQLTEVGFWDETSFVKRFEDGFFAAILTPDIHDHRGFTPAIQEAIAGRYVLQRSFGPMNLYVPKPQ